MNRGCCLLALFLLCSLTNFAQMVKPEEKIDPILLSALRQKDGAASAGNKTGDTSGTKIFPCIVYTTNPKALREKGITIDSVLPKFVTARLKAGQILKLAAMPEVSYIESPKPDGLHAPGESHVQ
jgi:hypothetical protein